MNKMITNLHNSIALPMTLSKVSFRRKFTFEDRLNESSKIILKYPHRVPVIVEKSRRDTLIKNINKRKYLVPCSLTIGQFLYVIRKRLTLGPEKALFLFIAGEHIPPTGSLLGNIYEKYANKDKFLYITYSGENVFG
jgi:GABA(A) receptor-associated protein